MKNKLLISVFCVICMFQSCLKDDIKNSQLEIFQFIWDEMDQNYGGFMPRNVNWDATYSVYLPLAEASRTDDELWEVCTNMLNGLDDLHLYIYDNNKEIRFGSGKEGDELLARKEFEISTVKNNYINDFTSITVDNEEFIFGKIQSENLGYIHIPNFEYEDSEWFRELDNVISFIKDTEGLIIDLRNNTGGSPLIDRFMAARFVEEEKLVFSIQTRNGPDHNDFDEPTDYYSRPDGDNQYTKPTMILTNHQTVSAAEEFLLFLETQDHITIVGDTTSNAFSSQPFVRLIPNGWEFGLSNQLYSYPDGTSPEGIGIVPDVYIRNDSIDVQNGIDSVLEKAIELL